MLQLAYVALMSAALVVSQLEFPEVHKLAHRFLSMLCISLWVLLWHRDPGIINHSSVNIFGGSHYYDYDFVLYHPKRVCRTTGIFKPARSKFCKETGENVARFDHYCPWVGVAIGEMNYALYLVVLFSHWVISLYSALLSSACLTSSVVELRELLTRVKFLSNQQNVDWGSTPGNHALHLSGGGHDDRFVAEENVVGWLEFALRIFAMQPKLGALLVVASAVALMLTGLLAFHAHLVWHGMTTNEFHKLRDARRFHAALEYAAAEVRTEFVALSLLSKERCQ